MAKFLRKHRISPPLSKPSPKLTGLRSLLRHILLILKLFLKLAIIIYDIKHRP